MKWIAFLISLLCLLALSLVLVISENFYVAPVTCLAALAIGWILRSAEFGKKLNDIGWGMFYASIIPLLLILALFIFLENMDGVPF